MEKSMEERVIKEEEGEKCVVWRMREGQGDRGLCDRGRR